MKSRMSMANGTNTFGTSILLKNGKWYQKYHILENGTKTIY